MTDLITRIQEDFERCQNRERAQKMSAYMKDRFDFLGIPSPVRNEISAPLLKVRIDDDSELFDLVDRLWEMPFREYQYLGMEFMHRKRKLLKLEHIPQLEYLVVTKPWWDTVDNLASKVIGMLLFNNKPSMESVILPWIEADNLWLNRTAIIFQLKYKSEVNEDLLESAIVAHADSTEFFHQKAIGWALRQYSKFNPEWVRSFLASHELSNLSKREAGKYL